MLPRQLFLSYARVQSGFFSIATIFILLILAAAIFILSNQIKSLSPLSSKAAADPATCEGKFEIPSCYDDGTPTAIQVSWNAYQNPDRGDCNVYLNGADPGVQMVVSNDCTGTKTYNFGDSRLLGNPLGSEDIYQLGIDNSMPSCTIKQVDEVRVADICRTKPKAGSRPQPPPVGTSANCPDDAAAAIRSEFGLTFLDFPQSMACAAYEQLKSIDARFSLVQKLASAKAVFKRVDSSATTNTSICQTQELVLPDNLTYTELQAKLLAAYTTNILRCQPDQNNLWREANNLWNQYGGVTPATYNPAPLAASPQSAPSCGSLIAKTDRSKIGEIVEADYVAALSSRIDPAFLSIYSISFSDPWCSSQSPFANRSNPQQCQLAERVLLKPGQPSICGQLTPVSSTTGNTQFGVQIDLQNGKTPPSSILQTIAPKWVRYVQPKSGGNNAFSTNSIAIFNQESFQPLIDPIGSQDTGRWRLYIEEGGNKSFLGALQQFIQSQPKIQAVEIWNEEDTGKTRVPPASYALMLRQSARIVKSTAPEIKVVAGGLAGTNFYSYIQQVLQSDPQSFAQVDAVSLHPYGLSPNGWGADKGQSGDLASAVNQLASLTGKPVWITEIGQNYDPNTQADYLNNLFNTAINLKIPVVIWYAWSDQMLGGAKNESGWGLYTTSNQLKPAGKAFRQYTYGK